MKTIIEQLANAIVARENCINSNNDEWQQKWTARIKAIQDTLPSGSGIDRGTKIDLDDSTSNKIVLNVAFHHMNENGFYDGWTEHRIVVVPSFIGGFQMGISGRNKNDIKEYLSDTYHEALSQAPIDFKP